MKVAFYKVKGNPNARWDDKIIAFVSRGNYSHVELVFSDGISFSSSNRDGGTRFKYIDYNKDNWDIFDLNISPEDEGKMRLLALRLTDKEYDLIGALTSPLKLCLQNKDKYFCSEVCLTLIKEVVNKDIVPCKFTPVKMSKLIKHYIK